MIKVEGKNGRERAVMTGWAECVGVDRAKSATRSRLV